MSEREVVFKLTASADPRAVQAAKEFEQTLLNSQKAVVAGQAKYDKERVAIGKAANKALTQFAEEHRDAIIRDAEVMKSFTIRIAQTTARELNRIDAAQLNEGRASRAREVAQRIQAHQSLTNKSREQGRQLRETVAELSESVMRVGRGFVALGLIGEENLDKVKDAMLAAQGTFDVFSGGLKVINKLEQAWTLYARSVLAAKAAQDALNASMPKLPSKPGGIPGGVGATGGMLKGFATNAAGGAGGTYLAGSSIAGPVISGVAAVGGGLMGLAGIIGSAKAAITYGIGKGAKPGSYTDTVGGSDYNPFGWTFASKAKHTRDASTKALGRSEERRSEIQTRMAENEKETNAILQDRHGIQSQILGTADKALAISLASMSNEQKIVAIDKARVFLEKNALGSAESQHERINHLIEQRGEAEKAIANTRVAAARVAMDAARKELDTVTSRIKAEQDALKTAEERFGMMSRGDQNEVMGLLMKARAGKQLDAGQVSKLKSLGTTEAERLASAQARNLAKGDYSGESRTLSAMDEANRRLRSRVLDITEGKTNRWGVNPGAPRMLSKRQKEDVAATQYAIEANERRAEQIRLAAASDTAMRRSIFGEERGALSASLGQRSMIEAKISQQLTVVAKFENTAQEVAQMAVRQMLAAQAPWVAEFERRLNDSTKALGKLQDQRRQAATGRS